MVRVALQDGTVLHARGAAGADVDPADNAAGRPVRVGIHRDHLLFVAPEETAAP
ncbi:hypothetical protein D3C83_282230 [compost metagenome]